MVGQGGVGQWVGGGEGGGEDDARAHQVSSQSSSPDHQVSGVCIQQLGLIKIIDNLFCSDIKIIDIMFCSDDTFFLGSNENFPAQRLLNVSLF